MKKFLAFLLIAIVACQVVDDIELKGFLNFPNSPGKQKAKEIIKAFYWLYDHGMIDKLKALLDDPGKDAAIALCSTYLERNICEIILKDLPTLCKYILNKEI